MIDKIKIFIIRVVDPIEWISEIKFHLYATEMQNGHFHGGRMWFLRPSHLIWNVYDEIT